MYSNHLCAPQNWIIHLFTILINTLRPRQNGRRFADDTFKRIFFNENIRILIKISLKFVPKGPINNNPTLVQIMAWRRPGDKPLSEPMMVNLLTHICVTRPQWVNTYRQGSQNDVLQYCHQCISNVDRISTIPSVLTQLPPDTAAKIAKK